MTMIENSDRGLTINKGLAWTMVSGLVVAGVWVGVQTTTLSTGIKTLQGDLTDAIQSQAVEENRRDALAARVRALETKSAARDASFQHLSRSLQEMKSQLSENNRLLRELLRTAQAPGN
jgi:hypothetical protein